MRRNLIFNFYYIYICILIFYYFLPYYLFDSFVFESSNDIFDSEILYNKILGQIFLGNFYILDSLLNGEYKWFYFTRIFYFINFFYSFFSTEVAFISLDILIKSFAYLSFYKFSKLVNKKEFLSFLLATTYSFAATTNVDDYYSSIFGFGSAVIPYLAYLTIKNKQLKIKNYLIIIFAALNSHFYFAINMIFFFFFFLLYKKKLNLEIALKIFTTFIFFSILSHLNIVYIAFFNELPLNRDYWLKQSLTVDKNIIIFLKQLFYSPFNFVDFEVGNDVFKKIIYFPFFFSRFPLFVFNVLVLILLFFNKIKQNALFLSTIFFILLICFVERTYLFNYFINILELKIIKTISLDRLTILLIFITFFSLTNLKYSKRLYNFVTSILVLVIFLFQINVLIVPYSKYLIDFNRLTIDQKSEIKNLFLNFEINKLVNLIYSSYKFKEKSKPEVASFKSFYDSKNFLFIKKIVKDDYVLPVEIDPAKLTYNNIKVIGGTYQFFPLTYKNSFLEIIAGELKFNPIKNNVYSLKAFVKNEDDVKINFKKAKLMNAKFVLSSKKLKSDDLILICNSCNKQNNLNLYIIK